MKTGGKSPGIVHQELQAALAGMKTAWPASQASITVEATTYTKDQVIQHLTDLDAPFQATVDARITYRNAVNAQGQAQPDAEKFLAAFLAALPQYLGSSNEDLTKFGGKPKQPRKPLTAEQKVQRAAKAKATREARHTMGKNQKKAIKGQLPDPTPPSPPPPPKPGQ